MQTIGADGMQTDEDYERLVEHLEAILTTAVKISDRALHSLKITRPIPKMEHVLTHSIREYLIGTLVELAQALKNATDYDLPMLIERAEQVGLGLDGEKSERRIKQSARKQAKKTKSSFMAKH
jgi:hypothetical protein